eukprot:767004-Hanusia_phi.AAC.10
MKEIVVFQDEHLSSKDARSQKSFSPSEKQGMFRKPLTTVDINKIDVTAFKQKTLRELSDTALGGKAGFLTKSKDGSWTKSSMYNDEKSSSSTTADHRYQSVARSTLDAETDAERVSLVNCLGDLVNEDLSTPVALASKDGDRIKVHHKQTNEQERPAKDAYMGTRNQRDVGESRRAGAASSLILSGSDFLKNLEKQKEQASKPSSMMDQSCESLFQGSYDLSTSLSLIEKSRMEMRSNFDAAPDSGKHMLLENFQFGDQSNENSFAIDDKQGPAQSGITAEAGYQHDGREKQQVKERTVMSDYYSLQDLDSTSETISVTISEMSNMTVDSCDISKLGSSPCPEDFEILPQSECSMKMAGLGIKFKHGEGGKGFLVAAVVFNGPAQRAGIIPGEILMAATDKLFLEGMSASSLNMLVTSAGLKMYLVVKRRFQILGIEVSRYSERTPMGISFTEKEGKSTRIATVIHGSPAFKAGVMEGDELLAVDPMDVCDISRNELLSLITGPEGSSILLGLQTRAFSRTRWVLVQRRSGVPLSVCETQTIEPKHVNEPAKYTMVSSKWQSEGAHASSGSQVRQEDAGEVCVHPLEAAACMQVSQQEEKQQEEVQGRVPAVKPLEEYLAPSCAPSTPARSLPGEAIASPSPQSFKNAKKSFPEICSEVPATLLDQPATCATCIHSNITKVKDPLPARRAPPEPSFHASMLDPMKMAGVRTEGAPQELCVPHLSRPQRHNTSESATTLMQLKFKEQAGATKARVAEASKEATETEEAPSVLEVETRASYGEQTWKVRTEQSKLGGVDRRKEAPAVHRKERADLTMSLPVCSSHRNSPKSPKDSLSLTTSPLNSKGSVDQHHDQDKSSLSQQSSASLLSSQSFQSELLRQQEMDVRSRYTLSRSPGT